MTDTPQNPEEQRSGATPVGGTDSTPTERIGGGDSTPTERIGGAAPEASSQPPQAPGAASSGDAAPSAPAGQQPYAAEGRSGSAAQQPAPVHPAAQTQAYPAAQAPHSGAAFGVPADQPAPAADQRTEPKRRSIALPVVGALVLGALVGGGSGAGIYALASGGNDGSGHTVSSSNQAPNITVNRSTDATTVTAVAAKAAPSVVTISVSGSNSAGTGSGIILDKEGHILTNTHVVTLDGSTGNATIQVTLADGRVFDAKVVGTDPIVDLAVIKIEGANDLTPISFGDSSKLNVGDGAIAIGAPLGLSGTVTDGIVSSLNRSITVASSAVPDQQQNQDGNGGQGGNGQGPFDFWNFDIPGQQQQSAASGTIALPVIQTDAAINPGNSGGALLDTNGDLIGVNVAIASTGSNSGGQSGSIGVGFAVPVNLAERVAKEIISNGSASHGLLGATVADASAQAPDAHRAGAFVADVSPGGAAEKAGIQKGDIITRFNGVAISDQTDLTAQVRFLAGGSTADLTYVRNGQEHQVTVTLGDLKL